MKAEYDYDQLFPGRFLKSGEFKARDATLTIKDVELEELEDKRGKKMKCIVSFENTPKQLVLNKTNGECLKGMFGRAVKGWIGKRVTFFPITVEAFGSPTLAIRVRGSPDLAADKEISIKVGTNPAATVTMKRTGPKAKPAAAPAPAAVAAQPTAPPSAEPPPDMVLPGQVGHPATPKRSLPIIDVIDDESEEDATARFNGLAEGDNTFP